MYSSLQIDAHAGGVSDLAFSNLNKQLCIVTCGDDKLIKVTSSFCYVLASSQMNLSLIIIFVK